MKRVAGVSASCNQSKPGGRAAQRGRNGGLGESGGWGGDRAEVGWSAPEERDEAIEVEQRDERLPTAALVGVLAQRERQRLRASPGT
jgi:hypothetical protein